MDDTNVIRRSKTTEIDYHYALDGADPSVIVEIYNPLSQGFEVEYAVSIAQAPRLTPDQERFQARMADYGIPVTKRGNAVAHANKFVVLPSGKTTKLPGHVAQVAVRQLRNEIISRQHGTKNLANPQIQMEVESEIIVNYAALRQAQDNNEDTLDRQIKELNDPYSELEATQKDMFDENPFPELTPAPGTGVSYEKENTNGTNTPTTGVESQAETSGSTTSANQPEGTTSGQPKATRKPGRPKKS